MAALTDSDINVLFLDEVINALDLERRELLIDILLEEDFNTFIVSHGWTHPLLEKIEIVQEGDISKLVW